MHASPTPDHRSDIEKGADRAIWAFLIDREHGVKDRLEAGAEKAFAAWMDSHHDEILESLGMAFRNHLAQHFDLEPLTKPAADHKPAPRPAAAPPNADPVATIEDPGDGWVYVIGSSDHQHVKIGTTDNVSRRLRELQTGSPVQLQVLWTSPGGRRLEQALHRKLAAYRKHGEWFDLSGHDPVELVSGVAQAMGVRVTPPDNDLLRAERHFLGSLLGGSDGQAEDPTIYPDATPQSFADARHALIAQAVADLAGEQQIVNFRFVSGRLRAKGQLDEAGGPAYLEKLMLSLPHKGMSLAHYYRALLHARGVSDE